MVAGDLNGTITVTKGCPKMNIERKMCVGSEITALEYIYHRGFRAPMRENNEAVPVLAVAFRSISSAAANAKSRIRLWDYRSNQTLADFDVSSEITQFCWSQKMATLFCSTWKGLIYKITHEPNIKKDQGYVFAPTQCDLAMEGRNLIREYTLGRYRCEEDS